jgi:hypothetical protein
MKILNKTDVPQTIQIVDANGKVDSIQLNKGRPVTLPEGFQIDPSKIEEYKLILKTDPPLAAPQDAEDEDA